jgi:predicted AAA+ superfamily ATPase
LTTKATPEGKRPRFQLSLDTRLLYDRIKQAEVGELVTYEELSTIIGRDVRENGRASLLSARRVAKRDDRIVFGVIQTQGIIRLDDNEIVDTADAVLKTIGKRERNAAQTIAASNYESLDPEHRVRHNTSMSMMGALASLSKPSAYKRIRSAVEARNGILGISATLEHFRESK